MLVLQIRNRRYQKRVEGSSKQIQSVGPKVTPLYHYAFFFVADHVLGQHGGNGRSGLWGAAGGSLVFISMLLSKPSAVSSKHSHSLDIPFPVLTLTRTHFRIPLAVSDEHMFILEAAIHYCLSLTVCRRLFKRFKQ